MGEKLFAHTFPVFGCHGFLDELSGILLSQVWRIAYRHPPYELCR